MSVNEVVAEKKEVKLKHVLSRTLLSGLTRARASFVISAGSTKEDDISSEYKARYTRRSTTNRWDLYTDGYQLNLSNLEMKSSYWP